jgi:hypothetical protein
MSVGDGNGTGEDRELLRQELIKQLYQAALEQYGHGSKQARQLAELLVEKRDYEA